MTDKEIKDYIKRGIQMSNPKPEAWEVAGAWLIFFIVPVTIFTMILVNTW